MSNEQSKNDFASRCDEVIREAGETCMEFGVSADCHTLLGYLAAEVVLLREKAGAS